MGALKYGIYPKIQYTPHDEERVIDEPHSNRDARSGFERDRSRVIHSAAFRRLQGKTQVFTTGESDFFRTRLTHSLEVAQIGKGLALRLGADTDLVEAICLLHDIGHPPFGHAGESELKDLMQPHGGFEANAQNIRLFTQLERKHEDYHGLNLTRAVVDGQLKYKNQYTGIEKKFVYADSSYWVNWASYEAKRSVAYGKASEKSFECQIMDWADDIAYAIHDLEDSIHARYIDASTFRRDDPRIKTAIARTKADIAETYPNATIHVERIYLDLICRLYNLNPNLDPKAASTSPRENRVLRKQMTSELIGRYIDAALRTKKRNISAQFKSYRYAYDVHVPIQQRIEITLLKNIMIYCVFLAPQILTLEEKGRFVIRQLFHKFMEYPKLLPEDWTVPDIDLRNELAKARLVSDYISGMTDNYAQQTYAKLFLPHYGSISDIY